MAAGREANSTVTLRLPVPPSSNSLFRNTTAEERARFIARGHKGKPRVKTLAYKSWLLAAGWTLKAQHPEKVPGQVRIALMMRPPSNSADCDNRFKGPIDLLVEHGIIEGDSAKYVRGVALDWADIDDCVVTVTGIAA